MLTAIGSIVGLLLALGLGRVLSGTLYQVSGVDPAVFATTPLLLGLASLLACLGAGADLAEDRAAGGVRLDRGSA